MHRLPRGFPLLLAFGLVTIFGAAACQKVPLLAPTGTVINLTVASDTAALNSSINVIAVLIESGSSSTGTGTAATTSSTTGAGTPVQDGTVVSFTTSIGTIEPSEAKTSNGKVSVVLKTAGDSGTATVTAYSGGAKSTAQIKIGAANAKTVTVSASPQNLASTGGTATVSARVDDANGNGVAGASVVFSTTKGSLSATTATTNSSGVATVQLTTTAAADVTATIAGISGKATVGVSSKSSVTVTGPTGSISISAPASFTVNAGTTIPVTNVIINYGDGQSKALGALSGSQTVSHFYSSSGIFDVTVSATDPDGVVSTNTTQIAVTGLSANVTVSPSTVVRGSTTTFTATVSPSTASIDHYTWDFGDATGTDSSGGTQTHVYALSAPSGTLTATVRVYPLYGASFTASVPVAIGALTGGISLTAAANTIAQSAPLNFTIDAGTTLSATSISINYGDGTSRSLGAFTGSRTDTKYYATPGNYTAVVTATYSDGFVATASAPITVTPISASVTASAATIIRGTAITYTVATLPATAQISRYTFDFGDNTGAESTTTAQSHVYASTVAAGTLTVTVRVYPVYGASFTTQMQISIPSQKGTLTLTGPTTGTTTISTATTFTIDAGSTVPLTGVVIDYGDGTNRTIGALSGSKTDIKFYSTPSLTGAYTVRVTGTDPDGNSVSSTIPLVVAKLTSSLTVTTAGSSTSPTILTATITPSSALIDRYSWDFGDGQSNSTVDSSTGVSPTHQYTRGVWLARVTVYPVYGAAFVITVTVTIP